MPAILKTRTVGYLGSTGYVGSRGYTGSYYNGTTNYFGYTGSVVPSVKADPLNNDEIDWNFIALNNVKLDYNGYGGSLTNLDAGSVSAGTLAVARGGTGLSTPPSSGQVLIGTSGGAYSNATLTNGSNISITSGSGSISIATTTTPSFSTVTTSGAGTIGAALAVNGTDITTTSTTFNLLNATATTVNAFGAATTSNVGYTGSATVNTTTNIVAGYQNTGTTKTINIGYQGSSHPSSVTNINIGFNTASSITTINSPTIVGANTAQALFNTVATTVNAFGAATAINIGSASTGTLTVNNPTLSAKAITASLTLGVTGNTTLGGTLAVTGNTTLTGDLAVNGGDITTTVTSGTFNLLNTTLTGTLNIGGAAGTINIGPASGTLTVNNTTLSAKAITASTTLAVTGNTTLSTVTVTGAITQGTAVQAVPSGNAPLFLPRAWGRFDGTTGTAVTGTYSQSNNATPTAAAGTIVTVTITGHGLEVGDLFYADITTGTGVDGWYGVATVIDANTFTYTAGTALLTTGNITLPRRTLVGGGNIKSIIPWNNAVALGAIGSGFYAVNFITDMPNANYAVIGNVSANATFSAVATNNFVFASFTPTVHGFFIISTDNNSDGTYSAQNISFTVLG